MREAPERRWSSRRRRRAASATFRPDVGTASVTAGSTGSPAPAHWGTARRRLPPPTGKGPLDRHGDGHGFCCGGAAAGSARASAACEPQRRPAVRPPGRDSRGPRRHAGHRHPRVIAARTHHRGQSALPAAGAPAPAVTGFMSACAITTGWDGPFRRQDHRLALAAALLVEGVAAGDDRGVHVLVGELQAPRCGRTWRSSLSDAARPSAPRRRRPRHRARPSSSSCGSSRLGANRRGWPTTLADRVAVLAGAHRGSSPRCRRRPDRRGWSDCSGRTSLASGIPCPGRNSRGNRPASPSTSRCPLDRTSGCRPRSAGEDYGHQNGRHALARAH